jgi:hypothetical protein
MVLLSLVIAGCGRSSLRVLSPEAGTTDAAFDGGRDAGRDTGPGDGGRDTGIVFPDVGPDARDGGMPDAPFDAGNCGIDSDCNDGVFCNGEERCAGGFCGPGALVTCPSDRCFDGFCDEALRACSRIPRDNDVDGFIGTECGGDDCDDGNPTVFPGAPEVCTGGTDDDCDALADCADTDCALVPACMVGTCPDRDLGMTLGELARGTTVGATADFTGTCRSSMGAPDLAFRWTAPRAGTYIFDTRGSTFDTVLHIRAGSCMGPELGCDDDSAGMLDSLIRLPLAAGDVLMLFVDGFGSSAGAYILSVTLETSAEICNNGVDDDRDGRFDCADPDCAGSPFCCMPSPELCGNGSDDDCDSAIDCADPDCVAAPACCSPVPEDCANGRDDDCDRRVDCGDTDCATSPVCCVPVPEDCSNGADDDCDTLIDCADSVCVSAPVCCAMRTELCTNGFDDDCDGSTDCVDADCTIDPACGPTCPERDLGGRTGLAVATGTTVGQGNDHMSTCGGGGTGADLTFGWTAPRTATYIFDTIGSTFDTVLHLRQGDCDGMQIACDDDSGGGVSSRLTQTIRAGTRIVIVMDGFGMGAGSFVLNLRPVAAETGRCVDGIDNDGDGFIDCVDSDCTSDASCCVPVPEMCGDGIDNDCDRVVDCADPNCRTSPFCCTPMMETCDNFADDDCDGFVDCVDASCAGIPPC